MESRSDIEVAIREAFRGVELGHGVSLHQAALIDDMDAFERLTDAEFAAIPELELTDDWTALTAEQLKTEEIAHLDPEGLRYYLPALMLRLLDHYDRGEMWTIGTISVLEQPRGNREGFLELLTVAQRRAIARYVRALPELVQLDDMDQLIVECAYRDVWSPYLADA